METHRDTKVVSRSDVILLFCLVNATSDTEDWMRTCRQLRGRCTSQCNTSVVSPSSCLPFFLPSPYFLLASAQSLFRQREGTLCSPSLATDSDTVEQASCGRDN